MHVAANVGILFFVMAEPYSTVCVCVPVSLPIRQLMDT